MRAAWRFPTFPGFDACAIHSAATGRRMNAEHLKPRDAAEVEQAIQWALSGGKTL